MQSDRDARKLLGVKKKTPGNKPGKDRTSHMQFVPFTHLETDS